MADVIVGAKLEADASGAINNVKNFKQELRLAQQEVVILSEKFGATSKEAAAAAKKAAELKDKIGDAAQLVDAFNPDTKFRAFGASIQTVVGGFTALTGAMGLLGVESEEVQKTLLKVQSALALSQGISQLQEGVGAIKNLGSVLVQTLGKSGMIGIAIAGVAALGLAIAGVFSKKQKDDVAAYNETLKDYNRAAGQARQVITEVKVAFEQARAGLISKDQALKVYNTTLGDSLGKTNDINIAEKILVDKAEAYIKITALKAQANALFAKAAEQSANALIMQDELLKQNLSGGGIVKSLLRETKASIDDSLQGAKNIEEIGARLLRQAAQLATTKGINTGGPVVTKTGAAGKPAPEVYKGIVKQYEKIDQENTDFEKTQQALKLAQETTFQTELGNIEQAGIEASVARLKQRTSAEWEQQQARIKLAEEEQKAKEAIAQASADTIGAIADLIGRDTAAGKVLAIAQATINTYLGASKAIAQGGVLGTVAAIGVIAAGMAQVKRIIAVKLPAKYDKGSGGAGGASSPLQPQLPSSTSTRLDRDQLNQIGNAAVRAFVVESDVSGNQERIRRLNRAARIG